MDLKKCVLTIIAAGMVQMGIAQESDNLIRNNGFETGRAGWVVKDYNDGDASYQLNDTAPIAGTQSMQITVAAGGGPADVQLYQSQSLEEGRFYTLNFMIQSDVPATIHASFYRPADDAFVWTSDPITTGEAALAGPFEFNCMEADGSYRLVLQLGGQDNVVFTIDEITMTKRDNPDHLRDEEKFEAAEHTFDGTNLPYRFFQPDNQETGRKYPLVLALHGAGERGNDNVNHIMVHRLAFAWSDEANQAKYPCFVLAPQCPLNEQWVDAEWSDGSYTFDQFPLSNELAAVIDLIDHILTEYPVDADRLYVTGLSMGGFGTWELMMRFPDKFAAAAPMSGGADPAQAGGIKHIPTWVFHGEVDSTVPVDGSRDMVQALEAAGETVVHTHCRLGDCTGMSDEAINQAIDSGAHLLYTEWQGKNHVMWAESYDFPQFIPWMFSWSLQGKISAVDEPGAQIDDFRLNQNYPNPFNPVTLISYQLEKQARVRIDIINDAGQIVAGLMNQPQAAGQYEIPFDGSNLSTGHYYVRICADDKIQLKKMILMK